MPTDTPIAVLALELSPEELGEVLPDAAAGVVVAGVCPEVVVLALPVGGDETVGGGETVGGDETVVEDEVDVVLGEEPSKKPFG